MEPSARAIARREPSRVDQPLFRPEAVTAQQTQWLGTVLLAPSISHKLFALFAAITAVAIIAFLVLGDYTRKERVQGWLVPDQGLIRIFAPQASVIKNVSIEDGQSVKQGDPLFVLSTELESESLGATQEEVTRRLRSRRDSLIQERRRKDVIHVQTTMSIKRRILALDIERDHRDRELNVQRQRVELATANVERLIDLRERGLIAGQRWQQVEDERLDHLARLESLERERAEADQTWLTLRAERNSLPFNHQIEIARIDRDIAALEQELAEAEARRRIVITAPEAGVITAVQAKRGDSAQPDVPLVSIIPAGSTLQAQLYLPTRARGFVKPGQRVLLRYQAFPYQKFGHHEGRIARIAQAAIMPEELARRLPANAGLMSGDGAGPVYPVTVALISQAATAYGESVPLQPGMQLEADVQIETRRLVEWMFEPLYTLTGRMQTAEGGEGGQG